MKRMVFFALATLLMAALSCKKDKPLPDGTMGTVTDIEGKVYKTVKIGNQWWMAENLKVTKLNDGTPIPIVELQSTWENTQLTDPMMCYYNNDIANKDQYGGLYNWFAVNTGKLAPAGWHVPTDADWNKLVTYLGGDDVAGAKLKEAGETHWSAGNTGTNSSGFAAVGGGFRTNTGFFNFKSIGTLWSVTEKDPINACYYGFWDDKDGVYNGSSQQGGDKHIAFSVRCVKD